MEKAYLKTENLSVGYQKLPLIKDICLSLEKGEILVLLGPNGAGKTTILKSIIRQLAPMGGSVYLKGEDMAQMKSNALSRQMASVQTGRVETELLTVEDVVGAGRYPYTGTFGLLSKEDKTKIKEAMEQVQITDLANRDFTQISDGQRQRVLLARALCQEPELLVLDEPTSFLDIRYKLEFLSILQKLAHEKELSVILSLHELDLAQRIADKVVCVKGDRIERFGKAEEVFRDDFIEQLFDIQKGSYHALSGSVELEKAGGPAEFFVIAGAGYGTALFRQLQRQQISFSTGILWENDQDLPSAKALSEEVLEAEAFSPISSELLEKAKEKIDQAKEVILALPIEKMTGFAASLQELAAYAKEKGKLQEDSLAERERIEAKPVECKEKKLEEESSLAEQIGTEGDAELPNYKDQYVLSNGKKMRCGFTTGSCAALATQSALQYLLTGRWPKQAAIRTPKGWLVEVEPEKCKTEENWASCAIRKDAGDDVDETDGALVYAKVRLIEEQEIRIERGEGVGRVTKPGLDQPVGEAAINSVPRQMIHQAAEDLFQKLDYFGGADIIISVAGGKEIAEKTFNPMLGIEGGISILGTSGIVEPMSMQALIDTIGVELKQARKLGSERVILTPGNYGLDYLESQKIFLPEISVVRVSNFIGDALDLCSQLEFKQVLLVGHIGKLVKLAGGIMNTHSRYADCRRELFCTHAALCGASQESCEKLMDCATTDACIELLLQEGLKEKVMQSLGLAIEEKLKHRAPTYQIGALVFSNVYGELIRTGMAEEIIEQWKKEKDAFTP
jgi:iron complex transport system ATP-binding protein